MKTTNYEISKQLKKNGLSKKLGFIDYYYNTDKQFGRRYEESYCSSDKENTQVECFSYDFETILQELPRRIEVKAGMIYELHACFYRSYSEGFQERNYIGYQNFQGFHSQLLFMQKENESLADTAAKLWLKLKKEDLL